jgi:hypothetical protein
MRLLLSTLRIPSPSEDYNAPQDCTAPTFAAPNGLAIPTFWADRQETGA